MASRVVHEIPTARFLIMGDGPCREALEAQTRSLNIEQNVLFLGSRNDVPRLLAAMDVFALDVAYRGEPGFDPRSDERWPSRWSPRTSARFTKP